MYVQKDADRGKNYRPDNTVHTGGDFDGNTTNNCELLDFIESYIWNT